jgi:hypothetical protein
MTSFDSAHTWETRQLVVPIVRSSNNEATALMAIGPTKPSDLNKGVLLEFFKTHAGIPLFVKFQIAKTYGNDATGELDPTPLGQLPAVLVRATGRALPAPRRARTRVERSETRNGTRNGGIGIDERAARGCLGAWGKHAKVVCSWL